MTKKEIEMFDIEELWSYACNGNIEKLKQCEKEWIWSDSVDYPFYKNYVAFGKENSLVMGAFRNNQFETVDWLLGIGCRPTEAEITEMQNELKRIKYMKRLCDI